MKLLYLSHGRHLGGAERCLVEAVHGLVRKGHDVGVIVPGEGELAPILKALGATVHVVPFHWWVRQKNDPVAWHLLVRYTASHFQAAYQIARIIKRTKPEVVITNTISAPAGAIAARMCGTRHIWHIHEFGEMDHNYAFDVGTRLCFWLVDRMSAMVIVNSEAVYNFYEKYIPRAKMALVYNAVDVTFPTEKARLPSGFNLVMVANIAPGKRQHEAIEGLRILRAKGLNIQLTLVGSEHFPAYATEIRNLIDGQGLSDAVHFAGYSSVPLSYMVSADIALVCSSNEAFGRATVEALKLAKPVIGACAAGTEELITENITGLLYEPGNVEELASKIETLYRDPELRAKLGANGKDWADKTFTSEKYVAGLLGVINQVATRCQR